MNNFKDVADITRDTYIEDFEDESPIQSNTDNLIDTFSTFDGKPNNKDAVELAKSPSMGQKLENYQTIMLEFSFEIEEINFKLKEDKPVNFDYIEMKISSFGTFAQLKTYSNHVDIYLKQISVFYGLFKDVNGETLI